MHSRGAWRNRSIYYLNMDRAVILALAAGSCWLLELEVLLTALRRSLQLSMLREGAQMKKLLYAFMLATLTLCLSAVVAMAQSTAGVTGIVKDSNGAVIAGAEVKLTDKKTGTEL